MLMTDQDYDGSHIKGLFINMIAHFWPALLRKNGFLEEFITPIVKVWKRSAIANITTPYACVLIECSGCVVSRQTLTNVMRIEKGDKFDSSRSLCFQFDVIFSYLF